MTGSEDANFSDNFSDLSYVKPKQCCPAWVYNRKNRTLFGRTFTSWVLVFVFYAFFFSALAGFFFGMMYTFMIGIVPPDYPLRTGDHSLLKLTPGLGIRPNTDVGRSFIKYSSNDPQTFAPLVQNLDAFLNNYYDLNAKPDTAMAKCDNGVKTPNDIDKICKFDIAQLGPCNRDQKYGYNTQKPCIFLKINKIYGWLPDVEDTSVPHPIVNCTGQNPLDQANLGAVSYYPSVKVNSTSYGKFDNSFFPYVGQVSYVGPIVAVHFENIRPHTIVLVECGLYNTKTYMTMEKIKFDLLVD